LGHTRGRLVVIPTLHILLLRDFVLRADAQPLTAFDLPRLRALLAYLTLHRDAPQSRAHLAFPLWPDSPERQTRTNLRMPLHRVRQALPAAEHFLHADGQVVQWRADAPWTLDVAEFE
jgi:DNA-binding SARP family transcriptional activator